MGNIHQGASDVVVASLAGFNGQILNDPRNVKRDFFNAADFAMHEVEIALGGADGSDDLSFTLTRDSDGASIAFAHTTSSAATDEAKAAAEFADAYNKAAARTALAFAKVVGGKFRLLAPYGGADYAFTITDLASTALTESQSTLVTGADPVVAPWGSAILASPGTAPGRLVPGAAGFNRDAASPGALVGRTPSSAVAHQTTVVVGGTWEDAKTARMIVQLGNDVEVFEFDSATDLPGTAAAAKAAGDVGTLATIARSTATLTFTATRPGEELKVKILKVDEPLPTRSWE